MQLRSLLKRVTVAITASLGSACGPRDHTLVTGPDPKSDVLVTQYNLFSAPQVLRADAIHLIVASRDTLRRFPAPYDLRTHGALRNADGFVARQSPARPIRRTLPPAMSLSDGNAWIQLYEGRAVYASVDIGLADAPLGNISIPAGTRLYAPTHLPRGGSCIEVVTVHEPGGQWPHWVGFWDWCSIADRGFWALPPQSLTGGSFVDKYVRAYTDEFGRTRKAYFVTIFADIASEVQPFTMDTWHAVLYNFNTGSYEQIYQSTGTANALVPLNPLGIGWSMWESFGVYHTCPRLRSLAVANLQIRVNGNWKVPDEPFSHLGADLNFLSCGYALSSPYSYAAWWSLTPVM